MTDRTDEPLRPTGRVAAVHAPAPGSTLPDAATPVAPTGHEGHEAYDVTPARVAAVGGALAALAVLLGALVVGGGRPQPSVPGLPDAGTLTGWGLPVAVLARDLAALATVGALLLGALLAPSRGAGLGATGARCLRASTWTAAAWAVSAVAGLLFSLSDILGEPLSSVLDVTTLRSYAWSIPQGRALVSVAVAATAVALLSRLVTRVSAAAWLLVVALVATLPPAFTGHSASAGDHDLAISSLVLHVAGVTLWVGGLLALVVWGRRSSKALALALPRFSALAYWCFYAVAFSGWLNALVRLDGLANLWGTPYGRLVLGKVLALLALGAFGAWHRERSVASVTEASAREVFARVAAVEVVVMGAAVGLAVALSRSPTPRSGEVTSSGHAGLSDALPAFRWAELTGHWRPDALVLATVVTLGWLYARGLRRLHAVGLAWPVGRTVAWFLGLTAAALVMVSGIAAYGSAMMSVHMIQHMSLTMLVPILLTLGAPTTLALRALPAHAADGPRGAREWLLAVLHSRPVGVLTHPLVALGLYIGTLYAYYFSGLFELSQRSHTVHLLVHLHFVLVGLLFFWPIIGIDPAPRRLPYPARMGLLFASLPFHAFFGVILMNGSSLVGEDWYRSVSPPGVDLLADQHLAGGIAWGFGELPVVAVLAVLFVQWIRADERQARREDRRSDSGDDDALERYNAHLAALAERDAARSGHLPGGSGGPPQE